MVDAERARLREAAHEIFDPIAAGYLTHEGVDIGRMFASEGLRVRGKIFAFVGLDGDIMIKVPAARTDALITGGTAERVVMRGRGMREWVTVPASRSDHWAALIDEAYLFVDSITPGAGTTSTR